LEDRLSARNDPDESFVGQVIERSMADDMTMTSLAKSVVEEMPSIKEDQQEESIETIREALRSAYLLGVQTGRLR